MTLITRRGLVTGIAALVAAPAIVRVGSIMPVRSVIEPVRFAIDEWTTMQIKYRVIYDAAEGGLPFGIKDIVISRC